MYEQSDARISKQTSLFEMPKPLDRQNHSVIRWELMGNSFFRGRWGNCNFMNEADGYVCLTEEKVIVLLFMSSEGQTGPFLEKLDDSKTDF